MSVKFNGNVDNLHTYNICRCSSDCTEVCNAQVYPRVMCRNG